LIRIGIYFALHGFLWTAALSDFGDENTYNNFKNWLVEYIDRRREIRNRLLREKRTQHTVRRRPTAIFKKRS
jgi:hypothetical protein